MNRKSVMRIWMGLAGQPAVVRRACGYAVVVGTILITINHGHAILAGDWETGRVIRMALTAMVSYVVSTFSSEGAMRSIETAPDDG